MLESIFNNLISKISSISMSSQPDFEDNEFEDDFDDDLDDIVDED